MRTLARLTSILALAVAIGAAAYLWYGPTYRTVRSTAVSQGAQAIRQERSISAREMGETAVLYWASALVGVTAVGTLLIWRGATVGAIVAAVVLFLAGVAGLLSIGMFILPVAFLLMIAGLFSLLASRNRA